MTSCVEPGGANRRMGGANALPFNPGGFEIKSQEVFRDTLGTWYKFILTQSGQSYYYDTRNGDYYNVGDSLNLCIINK